MAAQVRMNRGEMGTFSCSNDMAQKRANKETPAETVRAREEPNGKCAIAIWPLF